uniref:PIF1/LRR1 pleckstrin homology domain-containing protein n=1 Tax=Plectus sambesii TaxID=2011161 RepID=A0A914VKU0_9BILA
MRLKCKVVVQPATSNFKQKAAQGFIAVGKAAGSSSKDETASFELLVTTAKNKTGSKFNLSKSNVLMIHDRFVGDGKLTIQMKQPRSDIFISEGNVGALTSFVKTVRSILSGGCVAPLSRTQACTSSDFQPRKSQLIVTQRENYPHEGFPKTLEDLRLNGINIKRVDGRWFSLRQLTQLDLSNNVLGEAADFAKFTDVSRLISLQSLNLARNHLHHLPLSFWRSLPASLNRLDLSGNELERIPSELCRLVKLVHLALNDNHLIELPEELGLLNGLQALNVSHNRLRHLPATIFWLSSKQMKLFDATANHPDLFARSTDISPPAADGGVASLLELAAAVVKTQGMSTSVLPWDVRRYLMTSISRCAWCRKYRAPSSMYTVQSVCNLSRKFSTITTQNQQGTFVQCIGSLCSRLCRDYV